MIVDGDFMRKRPRYSTTACGTPLLPERCNEDNDLSLGFVIGKRNANHTGETAIFIEKKGRFARNASNNKLFNNAGFFSAAAFNSYGSVNTS